MGLERIVEVYTQLTETEKRIAESILGNPKLLSESSSSEYADQLFVSKTSIINFAKKIGFDGFSELKYYVRNHLLSINQSKKKAMTFSNIQHRMADEVIKTSQLIDEEHLKEFCMQLLHSRRLYVASRGASKLPVRSFCNSLHMLGISAIFIEDFNLIKVLKDSLSKEDTVLLVSLSGQTQILQDFANYALLNQCKLLSVTGFNHNAIQEKSDLHLSFFATTTDTTHRDVYSRLGMQVVLQTIIEYIDQVLLIQGE